MLTICKVVISKLTPQSSQLDAFLTTILGGPCRLTSPLTVRTDATEAPTDAWLVSDMPLTNLLTWLVVGELTLTREVCAVTDWAN